MGGCQAKASCITQICKEVTKLKRIFSIALALCLCIPVIPAAHGEENVPTPQEVYQILIALKTQAGYEEEIGRASCRERV